MMAKWTFQGPGFLAQSQDGKNIKRYLFQLLAYLQQLTASLPDNTEEIGKMRAELNELKIKNDTLQRRVSELEENHA